MSPEFADRAVVDTVCLEYFLFANRCDLLARLIETPLMVPRIVFDPDEGDIPADARSELTRGIAVLGRQSRSARQPPESRDRAALKANRLGAVVQAHRDGLLEVVEMTASERTLAGRLNSPDHTGEFRLRVPLGLGESACVAIAHQRGCALVTDDNAALEVYSRLCPGGPYERIRGLLQRAANQGFVSRAEANDIHAAMTALGFWDRTRPFPGDWRRCSGA